MQEFADALMMIANGNTALVEIVGLSLRVSLSAVAIACLLGIPCGALLAVTNFRGRGAVIVLLNALMGLPPVVVGLVVYMMLSASGPLGVLGLLYTPAAMIIAQAVLIFPIVTSLARQSVADMHGEYDEYLRSLGAGRIATIMTLIRDARFSLLTVALAGLGRAIGEVGAVMIVGGNINHATRVMTTTIALETSRGNLTLAMALGVVLLVVSVIVNGLVMAIGARTRGAYG